MNGKVPKRIATILLNSLKGGVVPRTGLGYIAVGREKELNALLNDVNFIEEGGATFRLHIDTIKCSAGDRFAPLCRQSCLTYPGFPEQNGIPHA